MKTQKSHLERQIAHSHEVAVHRKRVKEELTQRRYYIGSWIGCGMWVLWVAVSWFLS